MIEIVVAAVILFAVFAVTLGRGGSITNFDPDLPGVPLPPDRTLRASDVATVRFSLAFRGYRMREVDRAIDRLALEIAERDARFEELTGHPYEATPAVYVGAAAVEPFESAEAAEPAVAADAVGEVGAFQAGGAVGDVGAAEAAGSDDAGAER